MKNLLIAFTMVAMFAWLSSEVSAQEPQDRGPGQEIDQDNQPHKKRKPDGKKRDGKQAKKAPGAAKSQDGKRGADMLGAMFTRLDKNADGVISADEAPERMKERLVKMDSNGDGGCDKSELMAAMKHGMDQAKGQGKPGQGKPGQDGRQILFTEMDKDGNGTISKEEAPERMQQKFAELDANADGQLDKSELQAVIEKMKQGRGKGGDEANKKGQRPKRPGGDA